MGFENFGVFNFFGKISSWENLGNSIWLGLSADFFDVIGESGTGSLLNFGKFVIALILSGESGGRSKGFLGIFKAFGVCGLFRLIPGTEGFNCGCDNLRRGASVFFKAGFCKVVFFRALFRTGFCSTGLLGTSFCSTGLLGTSFCSFGFNSVSSFCKTGFSTSGFGLFIGVVFTGSFAYRTPILARIGGGSATHNSERTPIVNPRTKCNSKEPTKSMENVP